MSKNIRIFCPFSDKCQNYREECHHCKWNIALELDDYLVIGDEDSMIEFLESGEHNDHG